jgi:prepilin-type N-terminal cleavage/methylation domain-containing protein
MIPRHPHPLSRGFTLVELAVAMFIVALLLGSVLVPLATQVEQRQISDTQKKQDEIKEALIGYALVNGYLPCPAISAANGQEGARIAGICTPRSGFLPWETLGISKMDAWGRIFRYSVAPDFANNITPFTLTLAPDIVVRTRDNTGALVNLTNANSVPAIVISHGKNGYGGTSEQGTGVALPPGWPASFADENSNAANANSFVSRPPQAPDATGMGGEFDDIVTWVPLYALFNRMVAAGKLP